MSTDSTFLLAQNDGGAAGLVGGLLCVVLYFGFILLVAVGAGALMFWKLFEKAGKPTWISMVPLYNLVTLLEIAGMPLWWIALLCIPCVNIVALVMIGMEVAKKFGKDQAFGIGLGLLGIVFYPLLGFSDAKYLGPNA